MKKILTFFKKETVLCVSLILAVISMFMVPPDRGYLEYIDFRTLAILFSLMCIMAGLQKAGVFGRVAGTLLNHVRGGRSLVLTLVLLCFFSAMFITNDVALITFVPFTFIVLGMLGEEEKNRLVLPVVVMQTIAANLGSMLTPIGNPQNLYLYGKAGFSVGGFLLLMLPYTVLALALLVGWSLIQGGGCRGKFASEDAPGRTDFRSGEVSVQKATLYGKGCAGEDSRQEKASGREGFSQEKACPLAAYLVLFALCLLAVGRILPWQAVFLTVLGVLLAADRTVLWKVDYSLLLTFVGFFVFVGNVGRIPAFRDVLQEIVAGREVYTSIIVSQVISNVPAALLLSGFTEDFAGLIIGTNLGGLGTLIASMASLISYKLIAKEAGARKGRYIALFTAANLFFLAALVLLHVLSGASQ